MIRLYIGKSQEDYIIPTNILQHTGFISHTVYTLLFQVIVYNRVDCCSARLNNFLVTVGNDANDVGDQVCGGLENTQGKNRIEVVCPETLRGRYVTISTPKPLLTLCEVQVMGHKEEGGKQSIVKIHLESVCKNAVCLLCSK